MAANCQSAMKAVYGRLRIELAAGSLHLSAQINLQSGGNSSGAVAELVI